MNSIASEAWFRQRVIKYSLKHGITQAGLRHHVSRQAIYEWKAKYNGTWKSLIEKSHRPKLHPSQHTQEEKDMILRRYSRYKDDIIMLYDSLRKSGYERTYDCISYSRGISMWVALYTAICYNQYNKLF